MYQETILEENRQYLGDDIIETAKSKIDKKVKGEKNNAKKTKRTKQ